MSKTAMSFEKGANQEAKMAYLAVGSVSNGHQSKYKSLVRRFPMLVKNNGLAASLAFLKSKSGAEHNALFEQLKEYYNKLPFFSPLGNKEDLVEKVLDLNSSKEYRLLTLKLLNYLLLLKRFAEGLILDEEQQENPTVETEKSGRKSHK